MSDDDFDLSRFKSKKQDRRSVEEIVAETTVSERPPTKARKPFKSKFIQVPIFWCAALRGASGATHTMALVVLDEKHSATTSAVTSSCRRR